MNLDFKKLFMIDIGVILPIIIIFLVLVSIAFIDMYKNKEERINKGFWLFIIIALNVLGPILYFTLGRRGDAYETKDR